MEHINISPPDRQKYAKIPGENDIPGKNNRQNGSENKHATGKKRYYKPSPHQTPPLLLPHIRGENSMCADRKIRKEP
jgi:hypothetical protein